MFSQGCINFIFPLTKCGQRPTVCISVKSFTGEKFCYLGGGFQRIEKVDKLIRFILLDWEYKKEYLMGKISTVDDFFLYTQVHRAIMVITGLLTVIGVTLAFIYVGGWSKVCFVSNEKLSFLLRHSNTT